MRTPRPWWFDVGFTALLVALLATAAVLATDLMCTYYAGRACDWPWGDDDGTR